MYSKLYIKKAMLFCDISLNNICKNFIRDKIIKTYLLVYLHTNLYKFIYTLYQ